MASTIRRKASAQRANAIVFIAQPIREVPWHLLINSFFIIIPLCPLCSLCFIISTAQVENYELFVSSLFTCTHRISSPFSLPV